MKNDIYLKTYHTQKRVNLNKETRLRIITCMHTYMYIYACSRLTRFFAEFESELTLCIQKFGNRDSFIKRKSYVNINIIGWLHHFICLSSSMSPTDSHDYLTNDWEIAYSYKRFTMYKFSQQEMYYIVSVVCK